MNNLGAMNNIAISTGLMLVARKIPFDEPQVLVYTRIGYVVAQAIILGAYYYAVAVIKKKNDLTLLKYVEPPNQMTGESSKLVILTVRDYDLYELTKTIRAAFGAIAMMLFLHLYWGYTQPLFQQAILGVKALYDAKELKLHVLGKPAEGDLRRPFKAGGFFSSTHLYCFYIIGAGPQTDAAAIAEAEKKVGPRDEY
ncbi:inorganic phosphate transporter [Flagelloscypha sp. PMI_526]|nr:inorganic phosphate transporter [Flagelloscypha sp. PMI_526]